MLLKICKNKAKISSCQVRVERKAKEAVSKEFSWRNHFLNLDCWGGLLKFITSFYFVGEDSCAMCATGHMWKSEDNLQKSVLLFSMCVLGIELSYSGLAKKKKKKKN